MAFAEGGSELSPRVDTENNVLSATEEVSEEAHGCTEILGLPVEEIWGEHLSPTTTERARAVRDEWRMGAYDYILVMGGVYMPKKRPVPTPAEVVRDWLVRAGVEPERIILARVPETTIEQVAFGIAAIHYELAQRSWRGGFHLTVCSQQAHARRFARIASKQGVEVDTVLVAKPGSTWGWWTELRLAFYTFLSSKNDSFADRFERREIAKRQDRLIREGSVQLRSRR